METSASAPLGNTYDLYLRFGEGRFFWTNPDYGVKLTEKYIAWTAGGQESQARLNDIAEVHLQTGNVGRGIIATCRLRFSDGSTLSVASGDSHGLQDNRQARIYAQFVEDLHARLAILKDASIAFTSGFSEARYQFGRAVVVIAGLFFLVTPTVLLLITGDLKALWVLYGGAFLVWPAYKVMRANAPRCYDPQHIPEELVQAGQDPTGYCRWPTPYAVVLRSAARDAESRSARA